MDLSDALGDWPSGANNQSAGPWPTNPTWPGQPATNPAWPGGQPAPNPMWPGGQPATNPTWPGGPSGGGSMWPGGNPNQPAAPGGFPGGPGAYGPGPADPAATPQSFTVPYEQKLPMGLRDKVLISITGTVKPKADKFTVDLYANNDIAFHFNARFNDFGQKAVVRNSFIGQKWGKEERDVKQFPFTLGQPFELKILCTNTDFKVAVNNSHILEFRHRISNLSSINKLHILYDVALSGVQVQTLP